MPLEPVAGKPGLWRDPQWVRGMPGLYAVVIGVSAYPHLAGGDDPADDTLGLGQLLSSASTAAAPRLPQARAAGGLVPVAALAHAG
jgi:hypothetical protein